MKTFKLALCVLLISMTGMAHAMEGVFDRSVEVNKYLGLMKTGDSGTLAVVAKEISVSGIADPQLAAALNERLLSDYKNISGSRVDATYGVWMARALASFGIADYADSLKTVAHGTRNSKVAGACRDALPTIAWNQAKNNVMADDYSYKHYAAERMNWERVLDQRLMATIAPQVQQYVDRKNTHLTDLEDDTIANFAKLLGYSKDMQYRGVLENVLAYQQASPGVKRHAKYALAKLF